MLKSHFIPHKLISALVNNCLLMAMWREIVYQRLKLYDQNQEKIKLKRNTLCSSYTLKEPPMNY